MPWEMIVLPVRGFAGREHWLFTSARGMQSIIENPKHAPITRGSRIKSAQEEMYEGRSREGVLREDVRFHFPAMRKKRNPERRLTCERLDAR